MNVPFNDLSRKLTRARVDILQTVERVLNSGWLVLGSEVELFEEAFAAYLGIENCIGVGNGTDAIEIGLRAGGVVAGNKVATVSNAGMYTTTAVLAIGAEPVFMDVDDSRLLATLNGVNEAINRGAHAVVVTHLYGAICPEIDQISQCCKSASVLLLEDCAQSHGAVFGGRKAGTFGDVASFSFYPTKNLGGFGDGGAVVTKNAELANRARSLRQYGWSERYEVSLPGGRNSRLDEVQAAVLSLLLQQLDDDNAERTRIAIRYHQDIDNANINLPPWRDAESVYHLYVLRTSKRELLQAYLSANGIGCTVHYPIPDHKQPFLKSRFAETKLPATEKSAVQILSLPCYSLMPDDHVSAVIEAINRWRP